MHLGPQKTQVWAILPWQGYLNNCWWIGWIGGKHPDSCISGFGSWHLWDDVYLRIHPISTHSFSVSYIYMFCIMSELHVWSHCRYLANSFTIQPRVHCYCSFRYCQDLSTLIKNYGFEGLKVLKYHWKFGESIHTWPPWHQKDIRHENLESLTGETWWFQWDATKKYWYDGKQRHFKLYTVHFF